MTQRDSTNRKEEDNSLGFIRLGIQICEDKKADNIVVYDFQDSSILTDYCLICSVHNEAQLRAITQEVGKKFKELGRLPRATEGTPASRWMIMDYYDFLFHIFHEETREAYQLEDLIRPERKIYPGEL